MLDDLQKLGAALAKQLGALDPIAAWAAATDREIHAEPFQRDVGFLRTILPLMEIMSRYFDAEVTGFEHVPATGPVLLVGNHSGGVMTPDTTAFFAAWYRERGLDSPLVALAFDAAFGIPGFRTLMRKLGEVPANRANASLALEAGLPVLVYPGGDREVARPWSERDHIDFGGRKGFVELALRRQVPVVPVVSHGGHSSVIILTRGEWIGDVFGTARIRTRAFPLALQVPWGISPLMMRHPAAGEDHDRDRPGDGVVRPRPRSRRRPRDRAALLRRDRRRVMQSSLTRLAARRPYPVLSRLRSLLPFSGATTNGKHGG